MVAFLLALHLFSGQAAASDVDSVEPAVVHLSTLHWPPFTSADMEDGGIVSAIVKAAFRQAGLTAKVRFWPWKRAIAKAKSGDQGVVAYFPGYNCRHDPDSAFVASTPLGTSPIGLAERVDAPHAWSSLESLSDLRIGTVVGYATTPRFDARVSDGTIRVITSSDDKVNLHKLLKGHIDYAVIDKYVMAHLLRADPSLQDRRHELRFDQRVLGINSLYLCFRNDAEGLTLREVFNRALSKINADDMLNGYLQRLTEG